jgi:hypothetical protein
MEGIRERIKRAEDEDTKKNYPPVEFQQAFVLVFVVMQVS